jgi:hypothetical protein
MHPVERLVGGALLYSLRDASEVLLRLSDAFPNLGDCLMVSPAFLWKQGTPLLEVDIADVGDGKATAQLKASLRGLHEVHDDVSIRGYVDMQCYLDNPKREGLPAYWKTAFLSGLNHTNIQTFISSFNRCPTTDCMIIIEHYHGQYSAHHAATSVYPHRDHALNAIAVAAWQKQGKLRDRAASIAWATETMKELNLAMQPRQYVNYSSDEINQVEDPGLSVYSQIAEARAVLDPSSLLKF